MWEGWESLQGCQEHFCPSSSPSCRHTWQQARGDLPAHHFRSDPPRYPASSGVTTQMRQLRKRLTTISAGLINSVYLVSFIQRPSPGAYQLSRRLAGLDRHSATHRLGNASVLALSLRLGLRWLLHGTLGPQPLPGRARCNMSCAARCRAGPGGGRCQVRCFKQSTGREERRRSQQAQSCGTAARLPLPKEIPSSSTGGKGVLLQQQPPPSPNTCPTSTQSRDGFAKLSVQILLPASGEGPWVPPYTYAATTGRRASVTTHAVLFCGCG